MPDILAIDMPDVMRDLARQLATGSVEQPLRECAGVLQTGFRGNFERAEDSAGAPWPRRKDSKPHPLLRETLALLSAASQEGASGNVTAIADRELSVGIDKSVQLGGIPGAAVHNFGHGPVPQREYLYASETTLTQCDALLADSVLVGVFGDAA